MAKIYCIADIHGYLTDFKKRFEQIKFLWNEDADKLILLGDYIDRGPDSLGVLRFVHSLMQQYPKQIIALMGNHEQWLLNYIDGADQWRSPDTEEKTLLSFLSEERLEGLMKLAANKTLQHLFAYIRKCILQDHKDLIDWIKKLPLYYETEKQIFVHAGVDEEAGEDWKLGTSDDIFLNKFPAETGVFYKDIVAGHIGTASISGDRGFHDIFWDGKNHYYCDGTVYVSKRFPVLVYDSDSDKYYSLDDDGSLKSIEKYIR